MKPIRILVDSFADQDLPNAQMGNAREIICRLDPELFHVSVFHLEEPDIRVAGRPNTLLVRLPRRRQTPQILRKFLTGSHQILFYLKASPASKWYLQLRRNWNDPRIVIGTMESRSDMRIEPTVDPRGIALWEQTVLRCDHLFSNSQAVRRNLKQEYGVDSQVVPTGVDTKFFIPSAARRCGSRPRVLYVGSLRPFKQPHILLDAAARFPAADFIVVGDGMMMEELRRRIRDERLPNVNLTGSLIGERLRAEYQKADIFLFPSAWEGSPKVILEAAACGLPVIARKNYEPETVVDCETGYLVGSDEELFARLELLLGNPVLRRNFGRAGRKHSESFDWDHVTRTWEEHFVRLARPVATERIA